MWGLLGGTVVKNPPDNAGDASSIPGLGRPLEDGIATHSSILAWRIQWTEEPGGYSPFGHKRVRHDLASEHTQTVTYTHTSENSSFQSSMLLLIFYNTVLFLISMLQIKPTSLPLSASSSLSLSLLPAILCFSHLLCLKHIHFFLKIYFNG